MGCRTTGPEPLLHTGWEVGDFSDIRASKIVDCSVQITVAATTFVLV